MVNDKEIKEGRKRYFIYTNIGTQTHKEEILMTVTVLISVTRHMVMAGFYNYLLSLLIVYSLCLQQVPLLVMVLHWWGYSFLNDLGHEQSCLDGVVIVFH